MKFFILVLCFGWIQTTSFSTDSLSRKTRFSSIYTQIVQSKKQSFYNDIKEKQSFESHINLNEKYRTYLIHKVNFKPVNSLKSKIELSKGLVLKDRGEAHITVITPPEHDAIVKAGIKDFSMKAVEQDYASKIQSFHWNIKGIGVGKGKTFSGKYTEVYFLVVRSYQLRKLRKKISKKYKIPKEIFDPKKQDFHVTIGFTEGDLFNIAKDETSLDPDLNLNDLVN